MPHVTYRPKAQKSCAEIEKYRTLINWTWDRLISRDDAFVQYQISFPFRRWKVDEQITDEVLYEHFCGLRPIAVYPIADGQCKWVCIDLDCHQNGTTHDEHRDHVDATCRYLVALTAAIGRLGFCPLIERSSADGSTKVWILFDRPIASSVACRFGSWIVHDWCSYKDYLPAPPETNPKQLTTDRYGNAVRIFGKHPSKSFVSHVCDPTHHQWIQVLQDDLTPNNAAEAILERYRGNDTSLMPSCVSDFVPPKAVKPPKPADWDEYKSDAESWQDNYDTDLRTLDLPALWESFGLPIKHTSQDSYEVVCPWSHEHTTGEWGAAIRKYESGHWSFVCQHQHCAARSNLESVLMQFGKAAVEDHCAEWSWSGELRRADRLFLAMTDDDWQQRPDTYCEVVVEDSGTEIADDPQPTKRKRRAYTFKELEALPDPVWQIENHFPDNALVEVFGASGVCKTFYCLEVGLCIATGKPLFDKWECRQSPVLYVAAEGGLGIKKRIQAWTVDRRQEIPETFLVMLDAFNLLVADEADELLAAIRERLGDVNAGLIVVDTLGRTLWGNESSPEDMGAFIRNLDRMRTEMKCTVVVVHHSGHTNTYREKGSINLRNAADTVIRLSGNRKDGIQVDWRKQKDFADDFAYGLETELVCWSGEDMVRQSSLVLTIADEEKARRIEQYESQLAAFQVQGAVVEYLEQHAAEIWKDQVGKQDIIKRIHADCEDMTVREIKDAVGVLVDAKIVAEHDAGRQKVVLTLCEKPMARLLLHQSAQDSRGFVGR